MAVPIDLSTLARPERLTVLAQTRLMPSESAALDEFVEWCIEQGLDATRSSAVRTFVLAGLRAYKAESEGGRG